jgi:hypothetical protein
MQNLRDIALTVTSMLRNVTQQNKLFYLTISPIFYINIGSVDSTEQ